MKLIALFILWGFFYLAVTFFGIPAPYSIFGSLIMACLVVIKAL